MERDLPDRLSDHALTAELTRLARGEREATVALIAHLAEFDARRLYLAAGFSSCFTYCTGILRLSEHGAYNRIEVARATRRFPTILDMLGCGDLTLATGRLLAPHLTDENVSALLSAAAGRSKREVEELLVRVAPRPDTPTSIRMVAGGAPRIEAASMPAPRSTPPDPVPIPIPSRQRVVEPLAEDRYEIRFTARRQTIEKLKLAQALLRHALPSGDTAEVFDRALGALVAELARRKFAATRSPRRGRGARADSRAIPAAVRRIVWFRDDGRCRFVGEKGRRCDERGFLEFHHLRPYAAGGEASAENIELRCAAHNRYEAAMYFGPINAGRSEAEMLSGLSTARPGASSRRIQGRRESTTPP